MDWTTKEKPLVVHDQYQHIKRHKNDDKYFILHLIYGPISVQKIELPSWPTVLIDPPVNRHARHQHFKGTNGSKNQMIIAGLISTWPLK